MFHLPPVLSLAFTAVAHHRCTLALAPVRISALAFIRDHKAADRTSCLVGIGVLANGSSPAQPVREGV